ncbi:hypothetical protein PMAN_b0319 [Pseudoalteromonas marina]|nr:hypothetical protein PMAN_b0319 [Pseudoalteromonas marina]
MHHLSVELVLKNGDAICGVATDTKRNANRDECIVVNLNSELKIIVLTTISVLKALTHNPYFDNVNFEAN